VGPYTVIRTTRLITSTDKFMMFGGFQNGSDEWRALCALGSVDEAGACTAAMNCNSYKIPFPGFQPGLLGGSSVTAVPCALSVQAMNPNALQTTAGIFAGTVCNTQLDMTSKPAMKWNDLCDFVVSYMKPRLMSAAKLSLRGVQADAYPLNMSKLSDFTDIDPSSDGAFTWSSSVYPTGFSPIVFVNEQKQNMNYLVTMEWRVRFDITNPAVASHVNHGVSTDQSWADSIQSMVDRGHGMIDIAEKVADMGAAGARLAGRFAPAM